MKALSKIKEVSKEDLRRFLAKDHRSFTVLNVSFKQILSTQRTYIILSKPSAKIFYLKDKTKTAIKPKPQPTLPTDCRKMPLTVNTFPYFPVKKNVYTLFSKIK